MFRQSTLKKTHGTASSRDFPGTSTSISNRSKCLRITNVRVLYSKSLSVTELIRSGVSNYLEFQNVTDNHFWSGSAFEKIPFSKSEVFANTFLSFKEKR
jgi:RAB protein geranylgeranyltransferase component A